VLARSAFPFDTLSLTHRAVDGRRVRLGYALTGGAARVEFEETLEVPESLGPLAPADRLDAARALAGLHVAAGTSYWKIAAPATVDLGALAMSDAETRLWRDVYTLGMAEYFYRNELDPDRGAAFVASRAQTPSGDGPREGAGPALLLWGGGKDSAVSHEILAASGEPHELLAFGRADWGWIGRSAAAAGRPVHLVVRRLDPKLREMNDAGALNGHVPVNAILAAAGTLVAVLTGRPAVVASNELSASFGNAVWRGIDVNHQWSKSLAFERSFRRWLGESGIGTDYFSLLRPLTELRIVKAFATHPAYFGAITSCNANFSQSGPAPQRFCRSCAKCVFVALMARPWLDDASYHRLFGGDPLADPGNLTIVEELLGVRGTKPFECVGTPDETAAAIHLAHARGHGLPHGVMTAFAASPAARSADLAAVVVRELARSADHELTDGRLAQLDAYLDRH
jgi:hypothetical protein